MNIVAGEFVQVIRRQWLTRLTTGSGFGLWMKPFRGIHVDEAQIPIDLLYLDEECRVVEAIAGFPTVSVSLVGHNIASVLALPFDSIHASQTKTGDQLIICPSEKMAEQLRHLSYSGADAGATSAAISSTAESPVHANEEITIPERPDLPQSSDQPASQSAVGKKRNWLLRWLFAGPLDTRGAPRETVPDLTASFWTGGSPEVHQVRDISMSGMYVVTDERWYPGTLIRVTLAIPDAQQPQGKRSITVTAKAVRSGNDGVGFQFVLREARGSSKATMAPVDTVNRNELRRFLTRPASPSIDPAGRPPGRKR